MKHKKNESIKLLCPYCKCEFINDEQYEDEDEQYCENCDHLFYILRNFYITYTTTKEYQAPQAA